MDTIAIIPARSGSKRLKNKNILELGNKPLIGWTIEAALNSKLIDKVIVSTDSDEIASISKKYGAEVPFKRPDSLSSDTASSLEVIMHVLDFYKSQISFSKVVLLQPTSPLRISKDIDEAILQVQGDTKAVVSVCEAEHSPLWSNTLPSNLSMESFIRKENKDKRSQDLLQYYRLNGAIYVSEIDYFLKEKGFLGKQTKAYIMPASRSIDIDSELDFKICKALINNHD